VIVVVGRPGLDEKDQLDRPAALIALAARAAGADVDVVGAIGDDADGDRVALGLGKAGIGHAALLRDPAASTPRFGAAAGALPRLDGQDVALGLAYLADYRVLVVAEPVEPSAVAAARDAAAFQGASLIVVVTAASGEAPADLPKTATVLEMPEEDEGAFSELVGRYAAALERGEEATAAWQAALAAGGWETAEEASTP
jgi:hypothetical protein